MRYKIILKDKKEIEVNESQKIKLEDAFELWTNDRKDTLVKLNGISFSTSNIDKIIKISDPKIQSSLHIQEVNKSYILERRKFLALAPDKKASQKKEFLRFMFIALTGSPIPESKAMEVWNITYNFYKNNPNRMYPDPILYRHLTEKEGKNISLGITILLNTIAQDMRYARSSQ